MTFDGARRVLEHAIAERAFPAAVIEVGNTGQILWRHAFGRLTYDDGAAPAADDTIFDLASLTKVVSTTPLVMQQFERGVLALDDPVSGHLAEWRGDERASVTLRDLLAHCSPSRRNFLETKGRNWISIGSNRLTGGNEVLCVRTPSAGMSIHTSRR